MFGLAPLTLAGEILLSSALFIESVEIWLLLFCLRGGGALLNRLGAWDRIFGTAKLLDVVRAEATSTSNVSSISAFERNPLNCNAGQNLGTFVK